MDRWIDRWMDVYSMYCVLCIAAAAEPEEEPPSQPILGELTASQVTPDSVQLHWSVPEGAFDSFTVQYKDGQGQPQVLPVDGGSRTVTVPGLSPSRRYKFNLYGVWGRKRLGPVSTDAVTGEGAVGPFLVPFGLWFWGRAGAGSGPVLVPWACWELGTSLGCCLRVSGGVGMEGWRGGGIK